jgi:DNA-binding IclR family transcriptional regulator
MKKPTESKTGASDGTQSIQRVVALLRELTSSSFRGASCAELAARTGIDRTTAHRMLQRLSEEELLSYDEDARRYSFGPLAHEIGLAASERLNLAQLCKPALARIAEETGDTVFLMVRSGDDCICADRAMGYYPIKTFVVDVGTRRPLGIGAGSLAILSALPEDVADQVIGRNASRIAEYEDMPLARLRETMMQARQVGHVSMDVVRVTGVRAVGVAVVSTGGRPIAAMSIAAIASRMTPDREKDLVKILAREAQILSTELSQR